VEVAVGSMEVAQGAAGVVVAVAQAVWTDSVAVRVK